jgi:serine/threonine-protein kinase ULK/ATG1
VVGSPDLPVLKIADFGFARSLDSTSLAETLCGSPLYMAPEILRYEKYDAKADLWSVGAVLYEMSVGKPPFRAQNHVELLRKIEKKTRIRFPDELHAAGSTQATDKLSDGDVISEQLKDLIRRLLKRNPVERISFEEFFMHESVAGPLQSHPPPSATHTPPNANQISTRDIGDRHKEKVRERISHPALSNSGSDHNATRQVHNRSTSSPTLGPRDEVRSIIELSVTHS